MNFLFLLYIAGQSSSQYAQLTPNTIDDGKGTKSPLNSGPKNISSFCLCFLFVYVFCCCCCSKRERMKRCTALPRAAPALFQRPPLCLHLTVVSIQSLRSQRPNICSPQSTTCRGKTMVTTCSCLPLPWTNVNTLTLSNVEVHT